MKTLTLPLKRKWFEMIRDGVKLEEYRDITDYWRSRFCEKYSNGCHLLVENYRKKFDKLVFTLGYPKADDKEKRLEFNSPKIRIDTGRPECGAEPGKKYFVISWEQ